MMNEYEIGKDVTELRLKLEVINQTLIEITKLLEHNIQINKLEQVK